MAVKDKVSPLIRQNAKALGTWRQPFVVDGNTCPSLEEAMKVIPAHCLKRSLWRSMLHAAVSLTTSAAGFYLAYKYMPAPSTSPLVLAAWGAYALVEGTLACGMWVIAHECGHGAFSDNVVIQDTVGYIYHSLLLTPYFSWQRSHAVHHSRTNHMTEGETHVPNKASEAWSIGMLRLKAVMGDTLFACMNLFNHLVIGWPLYLTFGFTGGPARGMSSHFLPFNDKLFPGKWKGKVLASDVGCLATIAGLVYWARAVGSWVPVLALYGGPYIVANGWLVLYTWLQHTDVDIPHYDESNWTWVKGVFATVDRPYGALINFLHHGIGSTHVAHHLCSRMPHYHAWEATRELQKAFPDHYLYDPTPIIPAMWRVAKKCVAAVKDGDDWVYISDLKQAKAN